MLQVTLDLIVLQPLARARYRVQFTASEALRDKLERLQALLPGADLATLVEQAVTEKLERLEARRFGRTKAPRKALAEADTSGGPRSIPAPVRRAVYERAGGRCAFVDAGGPALRGAEPAGVPPPASARTSRHRCCAW